MLGTRREPTMSLSSFDRLRARKPSGILTSRPSPSDHRTLQPPSSGHKAVWTTTTKHLFVGSHREVCANFAPHSQPKNKTPRGTDSAQPYVRAPTVQPHHHDNHSHHQHTDPINPTQPHNLLFQISPSCHPYPSVSHDPTVQPAAV